MLTDCLLSSLIDFKSQNLDVDQIVSQHYQSVGTPQSSILKFPPVTPAVDNGVERHADISLPAELSEECSHGFKASN